MEKVGLKIVEMIHTLTQRGYSVSFHPDFEGMVRIEFTSEFNGSFYEHEHLGFPGCERIRLEKDVIASLESFLAKNRES